MQAVLIEFAGGVLLQVKLFNYPCVVEDAPGHVYGGHSSHVMNVRWSLDERYAVSVGGKDRAVFQWQVVLRASPQEQQRLQQAQQQVPWAPLDDKGVLWGPQGPRVQQQARQT